MPDDAISRRRRTEDGGQTPDAELLRLYAEENSEAASAELVRRHLDLVYSAALLITELIGDWIFRGIGSGRGLWGGWLTETESDPWCPLTLTTV